MIDTLREHLRKAGAKGGLAKGKSKRRGDSEWYARISNLALQARQKKARAKK